MKLSSSARPIGAVACGTLLWSVDERLHATLLAKASFDMRDGQTMRRSGAPRLLERDVPIDAELGSIRAASDAVPYKARCDVVFHGNAYAETEVSSTRVRLAIQGHGPVLDKSLQIVGDREVREGTVTPPRSFRSMPVRYELTAAGDDATINPVGVRGTSRAANVFDLRHPRRPAGLGPIPAAWRASRLGLTGTLMSDLGRRVARIGGGFDWSYFQSAPSDQQIPHLRGDEWLILEGLTPGRSSMRTRLPAAAAAPWIWPTHGDPRRGWSLQMRLDTLDIDGDAGRCDLTWRGSFPIAGEFVLRSLTLAVGVEMPGDPIDWPRAVEALSEAEGTTTATQRVDIDLAGTVFIEAPAPKPSTTLDVQPDDGDDELEGTLVVGADAPRSPATPWESHGRGLPEARRRDQAASPALPWDRAAQPAAPLAPQGQVEEELAGTIGLAMRAPSSVGAPFPIASAGIVVLGPAAIPGAPWSDEPAATLQPLSQSLEATFGIAQALPTTGAEAERSLGAWFLQAMASAELNAESRD